MGSVLNILLESRPIVVSIKFHSLWGKHIHSGASTQGNSLSRLIHSRFMPRRYLVNICPVAFQLYRWEPAIGKSLSQVQLILANFHGTSVYLLMEAWPLSDCVLIVDECPLSTSVPGRWKELIHICWRNERMNITHTHTHTLLLILLCFHAWEPVARAVFSWDTDFGSDVSSNWTPILNPLSGPQAHRQLLVWTTESIFI